MLRALGVEEEVRSFSTFKPGATFNLSEQVNFSFFFDQLSGGMPRYAYNVPRDRFDDTLLEAARKAGARIYDTAAKAERAPGTDCLRLTAETLESPDGSFSQRRDSI